jgi:TIR domain
MVGFGCPPRAKPLAETLRAAGATVWLDAQELKLGDSLSAKIDDGLSRSRFGVVIISRAFLDKHWPKKELAGFRAKEEDGRKIILPVWHGVTRQDVVRFSPTLADTLAGDTTKGIDAVATALLDVVFDPGSGSPSANNPSISLRFRRLIESDPPSTTPVASFLSYHLPRIDRYLGLGSSPIWRPYALGSSVFEAFAPYHGHGLSLTLYRVSAAWGDPFDRATDLEARALTTPLRQALSEIKELQRQFPSDATLQKQVFETIFPVNSREWRDELQGVQPTLRFVVFAGRRSFIDAEESTRIEWGRLREQQDVTLKTYDFLYDALAEPRSPQ